MVRGQPEQPGISLTIIYPQLIILPFLTFLSFLIPVLIVRVPIYRNCARCPPVLTGVTT